MTLLAASSAVHHRQLRAKGWCFGFVLLPFSPSDHHAHICSAPSLAAGMHRLPPRHHPPSSPPQRRHRIHHSHLPDLNCCHHPPRSDALFAAAVRQLACWVAAAKLAFDSLPAHLRFDVSLALRDPDPLQRCRLAKQLADRWLSHCHHRRSCVQRFLLHA